MNKIPVVNYMHISLRSQTRLTHLYEERMQMFSKSFRIFYFVIFFLCLGYLILWNTQISETRSEKQLNVVITTLIRSTNHSVERMINMIHSLNVFYPFSDNVKYSMMIFHETNFSSTWRERILFCINKTNRHLNISFVALNFSTTATISPKSRVGKTLGYRLMCRFWSRDIFFHPAIVERKFDYLMRMDADSYFNEHFKLDLFQYMWMKGLDYAYRSVYSEGYEAMIPVFNKFSWKRIKGKTCIYNNFFIVRLKWIYESEIIKQFLDELVKDDLMIREYIGDGCVHRALLLVDTKTKAKEFSHFSYGHNYHISKAGHKGVHYEFIDGFHELLNDCCSNLTIINPISLKTERIYVM